MGRQSAGVYGGEGQAWYGLPPATNPPEAGLPELGVKQDARQAQDVPYGTSCMDGLDQQSAGTNTAASGSGWYQRQGLAEGTSLPSQDYYQKDPALAGQPPIVPRGIYRAEQQPLNGPMSHYGMTGGGQPTWDQGHASAAAPTPGFPAPPPPPPPLAPPAPPLAHELSHYYRDPVTGRMLADRMRGGDPAVARYGIEPPLPRYGPEPSALAARPLYNDVAGRPLDTRQTSATSLVVDPTAQVIDGARGMVLRPENPSTYTPVATQRLPYDPAYDPSLAATPADVSLVAGLPLQHPQTTLDHKRPVDPEFLAWLRAEGLMDSTVTLLLQHGFDSPAMMTIMEDHDVRSLAPNLGQARVLSRLVLGLKAEQQNPLGVQQRALRGRSNSFSHRGDVYLQQPGLPVMDGHHVSQPLGALPSVPHRIGDVVGRRPSSAPSQHLLGSYPITPGAFSGMAMGQPRPLPTYNSHTGLTMSNLTGPGQQQISMPAAPKAYSTTYTVPMELLKRAPGLSHVLPTQFPNPTPQHLRKGTMPTENTLVPAPGAGAVANATATGGTLQVQSLNNPNNPKLSRRTGPPVIVSTMASPDTSNAAFLCGVFSLSC